MNEIESKQEIERKNQCIFQRLITGYNLEPPVTGIFLPALLCSISIPGCGEVAHPVPSLC